MSKVNNTSIIPIGSTSLVRAKNSIVLTNKILSERNLKEINYLLTRALELINQKKYKEAISVLDELIYLDSLHGFAYFERGVSYCELNLYENAVKDFSKVITLQPENTNAYIKLAEVILDGNWSGNIKDIESKLFFENTKIGRYQLAIHYCNKAIELEPSLRDAYFISGMCKYYSNENSEAVKDFDKAIELDPNKSDGYIYRGFAKMHNQDYIGVLFDENILKGIIPNFSFKKYGYPDINEILQSLVKYSNKIINNSSDSNAYRNRGAIKFNALDFQGALDDISNAIQLNPMDSLAYCFRALILQNPNLKIENYKPKALEDLTTAITISPDIGFYYLERAELKQSLRDFLGVIEDCSIALSIDNTLTRAFIFRGWAKESLYGLKYEENEDIQQYEKLTGEDMSGLLAGVNGNKKLYVI